MKKKCAQCDRACRELQGTRRRVCDRCQRRNRRKTSRVGHITRTYGLTQDDHDRLLDFQDGRCAITGKKMPYNLAVDHDHATGFVRGLLSKAANKVLRDVRDDPAVLRAAADYLENPPAFRLGIYARTETNDE